jgi:hypothetical protein
MVPICILFTAKLIPICQACNTQICCWKKCRKAHECTHFFHKNRPCLPLLPPPMSTCLQKDYSFKHPTLHSLLVLSIPNMTTFNVKKEKLFSIFKKRMSTVASTNVPCYLLRFLSKVLFADIFPKYFTWVFTYLYLIIIKSNIWRLLKLSILDIEWT